MEKKALTIVGLDVQHFAGLREFSIEPGQITVLAGKNASGKTSALEAIKAGLARGGISDEAINVDADRAEVRIRLSNDMTIIRTRKRGGSQRLVVRTDDAVMKSPASLLADLLDPVSLDPVAWLDGDREAALLDSMPLSLSDAEVEQLLDKAGVPADSRPSTVTQGRHALVVLAELEKHLAGQRRGKNAEVKQLRAWLKSERESANDVENPQDEMVAVAVSIGKINRQLQSAAEDAKRYEDARASHSRAREMVQRLEERIRDLEKQLTQSKDDLGDALARAFEASTALDSMPKPPDTDELNTQKAALETEHDELQDRRVAYEGAIRAQARIDAEAERLKSIEAVAKVLNDGVNEIRRAPREMLASIELPVDGLEYKDGGLCCGGVPLSGLSGAETIRLAAKVAGYRVRKQRGQFVLLDGLEQLDDEQRAALLQEVRASGIQWICTEVGIRGESDDGTTTIIMGAQEDDDERSH